MKSIYALITLVLSFYLIPVELTAQDKLLGKIDFPNSGTPEAQADFMRGMLFLHNFEYADAARAFRRAREKDLDFALAYYGEAKTYNHPIWMQQDRKAAQNVLSKLGKTPAARQAKAPTQREKDYLHTLDVLYGNTPETEDKSKEERDDLYREAMKELHEKYPDDHEAAVFYGLSILGTAHEGRDFGTYMKAAAELFEVWNKNRKHPGAAHYLIHSFDDPIHAPLGLPMARAYAEIAPAAAHAQHMTSHIFLALGMWEEVIDANIVARRVQTSRQKELNESTTVCGHYPWWLQYGYLQKGLVEEAENILQNCSERVNNTNSSGDRSDEIWHFAVMRAHQVIDSENWHAYNKWTVEIVPERPSARNYYFTSALAALKTGDIEQARTYNQKLINVEAGSQPHEDARRDIQVTQIKGLLRVQEGAHEQGLALLREAAKKESNLPMSFGPPTIVKPSHELLGDVLLMLERYEEAKKAYEKQLEHTPNRRRSVLGKEQAKNHFEKAGP